MEETKMEIIKPIPFQRLQEEFEKMMEPQKIEFCRDVRECWRKSIKKIYSETLRQFQEYMAFSCVPEDLSAWRVASKYLIEFEKTINIYIAYLDNFSEELKNKEE